MDLYEGDSIGGIFKIEIAHHTDFESFNPAVFRPGKNWIDIPFIPEKAGFNIGEEHTRDGVVFSYNGNFFINKLRDELFNNLNRFIGRHSVLKITDLNNEVYIIGAPGYACSLAFGGGTGSNYTDANGGRYQFKIEQPFRFFRL